MLLHDNDLGALGIRHKDFLQTKSYPQALWVFSFDSRDSETRVNILLRVAEVTDVSNLFDNLDDLWMIFSLVCIILSELHLVQIEDLSGVICSDLKMVRMKAYGLLI